MIKQAVTAVCLLFVSVGIIYADDAKSAFEAAAKKAVEVSKQGVSYNITSKNEKGKVVFTGVCYTKNDKTRIDSNNVATIINGEDMYIYDIAEKSAMKMSIKQQVSNNNNIMDNIQAYDITKNIPEEKLLSSSVSNVTKNGYSCKLVTTKEDKTTIKYYLTDDYGFPTCVTEGNKKKVETNIIDFKLGVSDDNFKIPSNVKITDMGDLSGLLGGGSVNDKSDNNSSSSNSVGTLAVDTAKDAANDTVVSGVKEGADEIVAEQKSKAKENTKNETKKALKGLFGI